LYFKSEAIDKFHKKYTVKLRLLLNNIWLQLRRSLPQTGGSYYGPLCSVYHLQIYIGNPDRIVVRHGPKSCGITTHHSHCRSGNSTSLARLQFSATFRVLGSNIGPYPCSGLRYLPTSTARKMRVRDWRDKGLRLEPNRIGKVIAMAVCIGNPAP
jgi:hypothetical protein